MQVADLLVVVAYFLIFVVVGCYFMSKRFSIHELMAGGKNIPSWALGLSIFSSFFSNISFAVIVGSAFSKNWGQLVTFVSIPLVNIVVSRYFIPFYCSQGSISAYSHLKSRFGSWASIYAAGCYILASIVRIAVILYILGTILSQLMNWPSMAIILCVGVVTAFYTYMGGLKAVIWTDVLQAIIMLAGSILILAMIVSKVPGGFSEILETGESNNKFGLGSFSFSLKENTFWLVLVYSLTMNFQVFGVEQPFVQRYVAAKNVESAKSALNQSAIYIIFFSVILFAIGTSLFVYYSGTKLIGAEDYSLTGFLTTQLPRGLLGVSVICFLASGMSSIDTEINACATLIYADWFEPYFGNGMQSDQKARFFHSSALVLSLISITLAILLAQPEHSGSVRNSSNLWDFGRLLMGALSGGILGLILLGRISKAGNLSAIIATGCAVISILWISISEKLPNSLEFLKLPLHTSMTIALGTLVLLLVGLLLQRKETNNEKNCPGCI